MRPCSIQGATRTRRQHGLRQAHALPAQLVRVVHQDDRILLHQARQQHEAVRSAENSLQIFTNRYVGGQDAYLTVITAQAFALSNERNNVDIQRRRIEASILLVKALGGGWDAGSLPAFGGGRSSSRV